MNEEMNKMKKEEEEKMKMKMMKKRRREEEKKKKKVFRKGLPILYGYIKNTIVLYNETL